MAARMPYTDSDVKRVLELRDKGTPWKEIAEIVNRNEKALYSKFAKMRREERRQKLPKSKTIAKQVKIQAHIPEHTRPMIALVGSPSEVTATIRELFS